jgi:hypothetical protein
MRFPRAASAAAKLLILLALGELAPTSASEAATKCPLGQILRVSLGVCVPKAQNLAILSRHGSRNAEPVQETLRRPAVPKQGQDAMTNSDELGEPSVEVAQRETLPSADQPAPRPPPAERASSPFGALFVGAFRSTVSAGLSAFR